MRISHGTYMKDYEPINGYGYATDRMAQSLERLGHEFVPNDPTAPVEMWFCQPNHWKWNNPNQYRIGYHPWESTQLKKGWVKIMNTADEIWTPSPLIAQWYAEDGIKVPIYVYQHGVDPIWTPKERKPKEKIRFLHCGAEGARKGGFEAMRAFRAAFGNRDDVELTLKMINPGFNIPSIGRTTLLNTKMGVSQLVNLFHEHDVYVYPSWGEGFGLTPLQAMATGMPTITVPAWAPYAHHLDERLNISSKLHYTQWPHLHPGKMFSPSTDDLIDRMRWVVDNYDDAHQTALKKVPDIMAEYDWLTLTDEAFSALQGRINL